MSPETSFDITLSAEVDTEQKLLVGLASPGMGALTAVDHLVRQQESEQIGHISPADLPTVTPFENGVPRHHTRLYNLTESDFIVLVSELLLPVWAARSFADHLTAWVEKVDIEEIAMFHSVPYPHGPEEHDVFYVATEEYRETRLKKTEMPTLSGGFLDGLPAEIVTRGLDGDGSPAGVFVTPAHPPGPDVDGALLFLDAIEEAYDLTVDRAELEELSENIKKHYEALADRMQAVSESDEARAEREFYADRMYM